MLVNVVLLWLVIGWPGWRVVPFLTEQMQEVIVLVVLSLLAGAASNLVNFAVDLAWVKALGAIITSGSRREPYRHLPGSGAAPPSGQEPKDARNRRL